MAAGDITVSFRLWRRPQVKIGGRYRVGRVEIDVDVISQEERLLDLAFGQLRVLQRPKVIEAVEIARPGTGDDGEDRAVDGR